MQHDDVSKVTAGAASCAQAWTRLGRISNMHLSVAMYKCDLGYFHYPADNCQFL